MRIDRLKIRNFRGFAERSFRFKPSFNVLIGDNGSGKTALLDALAVAAGGLFVDLTSVAAGTVQRTIRPEDVRVVRYATASMPVIEPQVPVEVIAEGAIIGWERAQSEPTIRWTRSLDGIGRRTSSRDAAEIRLVSKLMQRRVSANAPETLPLVSYYGTGRVWRQRRETRDPAGAVARGRLRGYVAALDPASDIKALNGWIRDAEWTERSKDRTVGGLGAIKKAVLSCLPEFDDLRFDREYGEMALIKTPANSKRPTWRPFHELSDGYRNVLGMVADIAYRAAALNPHLGDRAAVETAGLVLIDEIDLHLHPSWQKRIVDDLRRAFPCVQFVATTHSPFIVQSLKPGELIDLDERPRFDYADKGVEDIAENIMGVPQPHRSREHAEKESAAREYLETVAKLDQAPAARRKTLEHHLDGLLARFSDDPAYTALLQMERLARVSKPKR